MSVSQDIEKKLAKKEKELASTKKELKKLETKYDDLCSLLTDPVRYRKVFATTAEDDDTLLPDIMDYFKDECLYNHSEDAEFMEELLKKTPLVHFRRSTNTTQSRFSINNVSNPPQSHIRCRDIFEKDGRTYVSSFR